MSAKLFCRVLCLTCLAAMCIMGGACKNKDTGSEPQMSGQEESKKKAGEKEEKKEVQRFLTGSAIKVSAQQLYEDYQADAYAADDKYLNQTVEVAGVVSQVSKDPNTGFPVLKYDTGKNDMGLTSITCNFRS